MRRPEQFAALVATSSRTVTSAARRPSPGQHACRFLNPTRFGDDVTIETTVRPFRRSSFDVRLHKDGKLAVEGFETRVWVESDPGDRSRMKSAPVPDEVIARLSRGSAAAS